VLYIIKEDQVVDEAQKGESVTVILDRTPFYAESGGQVGDKGLIEAEGARVKVLDCKKTNDGNTSTSVRLKRNLEKRYGG